MCGISGYIDFTKRLSQDQMKAQSKKMAAAMLHRGPDAQGVWANAEQGVAFSHARLSVIDLTDAGLQPMTSHSGRYALVYNGEIYNCDELRREIGPISWRGHSDSEVLLEALALWGVAKTVERLIGMFAFALWDLQEKKLTLVRDRLGIKPLYYAHMGEQFLFGSELKAIMAFPKFQSQINKNALASYMRFGYVPTPMSIFDGVNKLQPGHILEIDQLGEMALSEFWSLRSIAASGLRNPLQLSDAEAEDQLDNLIRESVKRRMVADVPLGAFLSGGIDSSTVVAAMQAQSAQKVHTFSIGMQDSGYDEAEDAKKIAQHLGTNHTELYIAPKDAQSIIPDLASFYDEPFADSSQIPTYLVSKLARGNVTVSLSGDGGDELFCGYNRYQWGVRIWGKVGALPLSVRKLSGNLIETINPQGWDRLSHLMPASRRPRQFGIKMHKAASALTAENPDELYRNVVSFWGDPEQVVLASLENKNVLWDQTLKDDIPAFATRMQVMDGLTYLPDDILTKVDRASMAVSLEARVPLLDHRIVEFAFGLPSHMKVRDRQGKWLLRKVLERYVPRPMFERPKMGFGIPIGDWLKGDLHDWAEDLLSPEKLAVDGLLNAAPIRKIWDMHQNGQVNAEAKIWTILMFQAWREKWHANG